jgi:hypothetical protein
LTLIAPTCSVVHPSEQALAVHSHNHIRIGDA